MMNRDGEDMRENAWLKRNPAIALGLCGFVGALVNIVTFLANSDALIFAHGLFFGVILAGYLIVAKNLHWFRATILTLLFGASWYAAFISAIYLSDVMDDGIGGLSIMSMLSGGLGAIIVAIAFSVAYPKFASVKSIAITVAVGTIAGLLLVYELEYSASGNMSLLWIVWQTAIGASLGWNQKVFE